MTRVCAILLALSVATLCGCADTELEVLGGVTPEGLERCKELMKSKMCSVSLVKDVENLLDHIVIIDNRGLIVDASTYDICQKLHFAIESSADGALYSTPSLGGYATVRPNTTDAESNIDLELLFGVATSQREEIKSILNPSTK